MARPPRSECSPSAVAAAPAATTEQAKRQSKHECLRIQRHSFLLPAQLLLRGATLLVASSSCPVRVASCLISSLIQIASAASSSASAIRRQGPVCWRSLEESKDLLVA